VDLRRENPSRIDRATTPWLWPLQLSVSEVVGLLAWPLGDGDLPGMPPLHPKRLRVPACVTSTERIFATASTPSSERLVGITTQDGLGHCVAWGPTGSAKSTVWQLLVKASAEAGQAIVVIDPKRQLIDDIVDRAIPEDRIDDVAIIDPSDTHPVGFNPLDVGDRDPDVVVDGLVSVLANVFHDGWGPRTADIVTSGALSLCKATQAQQSAESPDAEPHTLLDLPRLFVDARFRESVIGHVTHDPGLGSFWAWFNGLNPGAQAQALAAPMNKLRRIMLRPALRAILGEPSPGLRMRDVFRERRIVLVAVNEGLVGPIAAALVGQLVIAEAWLATLERAAEEDPALRPAAIFVDEAAKFVSLPTSIEDALAQSRSLGVAWHTSFQYRRQAGPELLHGLDTNAKTKIVWRLLDPDDARDFARQAPELEPIDFQSLGRFEAYANINTDGAPSGWCHVRTLPPPGPTGLGNRIRAASRRNFTAAASAKSDRTETKDDSPVGRKRRKS
jgi:hypothetical protein